MEAGGLQLASPDVQVIRQALAEHSDGPLPVDREKDLSVETVEQESIDIALYQARDTNKMVRLRCSAQRVSGGCMFQGPAAAPRSNATLMWRARRIRKRDHERLSVAGRGLHAARECVSGEANREVFPAKFLVKAASLAKDPQSGNSEAASGSEGHYRLRVGPGMQRRQLWPASLTELAFRRPLAGLIVTISLLAALQRKIP